jgi:hypothetical protein
MLGYLLATFLYLVYKETKSWCLNHIIPFNHTLMQIISVQSFRVIHSLLSMAHGAVGKM